MFQKWLDDRAAFALYLSELPGHDDTTLVLDRMLNDVGYVPGNLRYTTRVNSRRNRREFYTETRTLT